MATELYSIWFNWIRTDKGERYLSYTIGNKEICPDGEERTPKSLSIGSDKEGRYIQVKFEEDSSIDIVRNINREFHRDNIIKK
jgi:hypothetical protein